jgi:uncharacterized repeat protein (TIGR03837 family)
MFLPGFTGLTGGLILDRPFIDAKARLSDPAAAPSARRIMAEGAGLSLEPGYENRFWMLVFSYERDYGRIVDDMAALARDRPVLALVASGRSEGCFIAAWERAGRPFPVVRVPFLGQERWDELLLASDFAIVRGEDSLSRAALSGKPFLWHAYPQDEAYQLVKVLALLDRMRPQFSAADFRPIEAAFIAFNDRLIDDPQTRGDERILPLLEAGDEVRAGFLRFAEALAVNGNLAAHLMTFLREVV